MILENDKVYTFKIANGDELIGKVIAQTETEIVIHQPLTIIPGPQGIQLLPSLFTTELAVDVTINKNNIVMMAETREQVCDSYLESTTGIKPIRKQILMT
jgi:hypothetical protein